MSFDGGPTLSEMNMSMQTLGQSPPNTPLFSEFSPKLLDFETSFYNKFDNDIKQYTTEITNKIAEWIPERTIVLTRLQEIANKTFVN